MQASIAKFGDFTSFPLNDSKATRRRWLVTALTGVAVLTGSPFASVAADSKSSGEQAAATKITRVKSVLEVKGNVKLKNNQAKKADDYRSAPIAAKSTLEYEEEFRAASSKSETVDEAAYQTYSLAELDNLIGKHPTKLKLREPCREIIKISSAGKMSTACLNHPLTVAERDLVEGPLSTMHLERLLPSKAIELGDSWELDSIDAAKLLNLDEVTTGTIKITLVDADAEFGQLELKGTLQGEIRNIGTKIKLEGKAKIDRKKGIISWLALSLEEDRDVSETEPGFTIQARIRILRERIDSMSSGQSLREVESQLDEKNSIQLSEFDSQLGAYRFVADRDWITYNDSGVDATLRWIQKNRVVAQCSVTNMTDMEPGRQLSIEGYQNDIQTSLAKRFSRFLEADERISTTGLRMMRVVTLGQVESVPVQWIHILLSNDAGRHLALAYSMNVSSVASFGTNDLQMASTLEFTLKELPVAPSESKPENAADAKAAEAKSAAKPAIVLPKR